MKIVIVGGNGTIGRSVATHFKGSHEVIIAARNSGDVRVDLTHIPSIEAMFHKTGKMDALICTAGEAKWDAFGRLSEADYYVGIKSKLMGQVNLSRLAIPFINHGGSITLTTGILADEPVEKTASAAMVNGAIHSFVKAAALEIKNGVRLNTVSTGLVMDAYEQYKNYFPGHRPIPMDKMMEGYVQSVMGKESGRVFRIYS